MSLLISSTSATEFVANTANEWAGSVTDRLVPVPVKVGSVP